MTTLPEPNKTAALLIAETLADAEAEWRERFDALAVECDARAALNREAVHALHQSRQDIRRHEATIEALRAELRNVVADNRRLRVALLQGAA